MTIPLLVTADVEIALDHDLHEQGVILEDLRRDLGALGMPITAFTTADAAERFATQVQRLQNAGHEVACHGLTHAADEDFSRMPAAAIQQTLDMATRRIAAVTGQRPRCFRGPRMTSSAATQRVLVDEGYVADFSVCSQRLDLLNCRGARLEWLVAPRRPYFPSPTSPFRKGSVPIRVVPLSCVGAPFLSGMLYAAGLGVMMALFRILLAEARRTSKPIVYLFHPYEFSRYHGKASRPDGAHRKALHGLYEQDRMRRYADTLALLRFMLSHAGVRPMTGRAYVQSLGGAEAGRPACTSC